MREKETEERGGRRRERKRGGEKRKRESSLCRIIIYVQCASQTVW